MVVNPKLRPAFSEHVLYKPSINHFLDNWNDRRKNTLEELNVEILHNALSPFRRERADSGDSTGTMSETEEREMRRLEKKARRERRRNSVLLVLNHANSDEDWFSRPRASSDPDLRPVQSTSNKDKRVAFALEPLRITSTYIDATHLSPNTKPILVKKKRRASCLPTTEELMDYQTFDAWRRGSRVSMDVAMEEQLRAAQERLRAAEARRKEASLLSSMVASFKNCFVHRTARTSPVSWVV